MTPPLSPKSDYSENALIEQPAISLFKSLGWETKNLFSESFGFTGTEGRGTEQEVFLVRRLRQALGELNPDLPADAISAAIEELTRDRGVMSPAAANREVYLLLKDGINVIVKEPDGGERPEKVKVIDWQTPRNNRFLLASQFWVSGDLYRRRCDLVGFVNGIPLAFMELKASHKHLEDAYEHNLDDYKTTVPQLFTPNGLIILSNGSESRVGSMTASWDHFGEWKKVNDEGEQGVVSLETMIRGTCEPARLLDLIENFTVFEKAESGLIKKIAKNHQYLGVNQAIRAVGAIKENRGRLGVFWHTQGSGKSISMVFFAQKILRTVPGNWTFVVVTDREELDDQIYKQFVACGAVTEARAQAGSGEQLKQLLGEDHRYVFTLIQKFHSPRGTKYPKLSDRADVIVITDEAHRSQYDIFAANMRSALPNAAFIGFTGTPLMAGEERTREVFGEYVSIYNYRQSVEDGATVPLFYENRIPELQLANEDLNEDMERLLVDAELDEEQQKRVEREFARQYHLVTREDRLEAIAKDIVAHFLGRGGEGKAMVVSIDKATAVRMYDKVQKYWKGALGELKAKRESAAPEEQEPIDARIAYMAATDMAVVVSQAQNEARDMAKKGLNIVPHRTRMVKEDLAEKFKDPEDPLRLVFVCAMWMTGFDVPSCSTIYLDKPMQNHTLMQTIARANRVFGDKVNGLIVDYVGVFRNLQKALAIYAAPGTGGGDSPIKDKAELLRLLEQAVGEASTFCGARMVDLPAIQAAPGFAKVKLIDDARDVLVVNDAAKREFLMLSGRVELLYRAILPDQSAAAFAAAWALLTVLADKIRSLTKPADISKVMGAVEALLDQSIAAEGYVIAAGSEPDRLVDLSKIDFEKLKAKFATARKHTEIEKLRAAIGRKLNDLVALNRSRTDYLERFQKLIDEYNAGSVNLQDFFDKLVVFAQGLNAEEKRSIRENLTEEELALFDILTKPEPKLTKQEEIAVKKVATELLEKLKREKLVLDWRKRQQARQAVRLCVEQVLDTLPTKYTPALYEEKCDRTYRHVYESYFGEGKSIYAKAS